MPAAQAETARPDKLSIKGLLQIFGSDIEQARQLAATATPAEDIRSQTGSIVAVRNVDLSVAAGEIFVIMGLSGSGKSTLIRCINQLITPTAGEIRLDGVDTLAYSGEQRREMRRHKVAMVFQNFALLRHRTVLQNVEYGLAIRGESAAIRVAKAKASLEMVGLGNWADQYPEELSGGMKQRVGLARALATDPDVLLMDEPFSALDPLIRRNLQDELLKLQHKLRKTIVFVTHDFHEAVKLGDSIAVMRDGEIVQCGTPREIILRPNSSYVANFTRDIDISQALSAGDVARFAQRRGSDAALPPRDGVAVDESAPFWQLYPVVASGDALVAFEAGGAPIRVSSRDVLECLAEHEERRRPGSRGTFDD